MIKLSKIFIGASLFAFSATTLAAAGPTVNKYLTVNVKQAAAINATWTPAADVSLSGIRNANTLVGVLNLSNTNIQSATIGSTNTDDNSKEGIFTFTNDNDKTQKFTTIISAENGDVLIEKNTGSTTIKPANAQLLPENLSLNFRTEGNSEKLASGQYTANIAITTTIF